MLAGLSHVIHALRAASKQAGRGPSAAAPDEATIEAFGGVTRTRTLAAWGNTAFARGTVPEIWQVRDRSDSGCRLRGKTADLNSVIPGSLLAMRDERDRPVVRGGGASIATSDGGSRRGRRRYRMQARFVRSRWTWIRCHPWRHRARPSRNASGRSTCRPARRFRRCRSGRCCCRRANSAECRGNAAVVQCDVRAAPQRSDRHQMEFVWTSFTVIRKNAR